MSTFQPSSWKFRLERFRRSLQILKLPLSAETVRIGLHEMSAYYRVCVVRDARVLLYVGSTSELHRARAYETAEPETLQWIETVFHPGDVFYDVGANVGIYSLFAAVTHPRVTVFAFEPEALNFASLNSNIAVNRLTNVTAICAALTDRDAFGELFVSALRAGDSGHVFGQAIDHLGRTFDEEHRQGSFCHTIDGLQATYGFPPPTHIKIDVDGQEMRVLGGMSTTLGRGDLKSMLIEAPRITEERASLVAAVEGTGFRLVHPADASSAARNIIFVR